MGPANVDDLVAELDWASARGIDARGYEAASRRGERRTTLSVERVADTMAAYRREKQRRGVVVKEKATVSQSAPPPPLAELERSPAGEEVRSPIGALLYGVRGTRPDLAWATSQLARYEERWYADPWPERELQHLLGFVKGTAHYGLRFKSKHGLERIIVRASALFTEHRFTQLSNSATKLVEFTDSYLNGCRDWFGFDNTDSGPSGCVSPDVAFQRNVITNSSCSNAIRGDHGNPVCSGASGGN